MNKSRFCAALIGALALLAADSANADPAGSTIVLNTYNRVLPQLIGDALGPTTTVNNVKVPKVGRNTGVGYMDSQLKMDDSPAAKANFGSEVTLLITATRTDNKVNDNSDNSYMQGAFSVVKLAATGPQVDQMKTINLPRLEGDRAWQKPNIAATNKYYLLIAASEDNGASGNPQVVAFVYDKVTLQPVHVLNTNRRDGGVNGTPSTTLKPTNLIELSGDNDGQQYGPHSIQRVSASSFVLGVQRNNDNAYVMRVTVDEAPTTGVNLKIDYLKRVVDNAQHCRPDVAPIAEGSTTAFLTSVEANSQPADIGVRVLSFDVNTGKVIKSVLVVKSEPKNNKYAVQPNIADLGKYLGLSYQMSEKTRKGDDQGHTGGSNLSMLMMLDKTTLAPVGTSIMAVAPYARHAASVGALWGEVGKEMPSVVSLGGSSTGTGKGFAQIVPVDVPGSKLGTKDPAKLYEVSKYSDIAGTVVRGKRNPNNQGRGFIYALSNIPNPGYGGGNTAFMPEVKTFIGSAVQGYTNADTAKLAARESIWLSLVPSTWVPGQQTMPGGATDKPGTNADGTGPLPRVNGPSTSTDPNATGPGSVIPGGPSPEPGGFRPGLDDAEAGCSVSRHGTTGGTGALVLVGLGLLLALRRKQDEEN